MLPQYIINVPHLLEHEQDGLSRATVISLAGSLTSLCFGPTMVKDDIAAVAARHQRIAGGQGRTPLGAQQAPWDKDHPFVIACELCVSHPTLPT